MVTIDKALFKMVQKHHKPLGYVAAVDAGLVGWSKFNYKIEPGKFDKQKAKEIAYGRAVKAFRLHNRLLRRLTTNPLQEVPPSMRKDFVEMDARSRRYFKPKSRIKKLYRKVTKRITEVESKITKTITA